MSNAPSSSAADDDGSSLLQDMIIDDYIDSKKSSPSSSSIELHAYHYNLPSPCNDHPEWTITHYESLTDELTALIDVDLSNVKEPLVNKKITRVYTLIMALMDLKYPLSLNLRRSIIKRCLELFILTTHDITKTDDGSYHYHLDQPIVTIPPSTPTPTITLQSPSPNHPSSSHLSPPTRDKLLQITLALLDKKTALFSSHLIIHWQTLLHQLFLEIPHLHHQNNSTSPPTSSSHITSSIHRRLILIISSSRRFFDDSSEQIFNLFQWDKDPETILSFRNLALRTLFLPTSPLMTPHVATWVEEWGSIPRNSHVDFCFLILLSRARKFSSGEDDIWVTVCDLIISRLGYWLQLPLGGFDDSQGGGGSSSVTSGSFPRNLRMLLLRGSDGDLVQRFVKKISKLLAFGLGLPGVSRKVTRFFTWTSPFLHPSNSGRWVYGLSGLLGSFSFCLSERVGREGDGGRRLLDGGEVVLLLDAMYPLIFQAIYSKSSHVERLGLESFTNLLPIAPTSILPYTISFSLQALSHASIHSAHQAPSALSLLKRTIVPGLRFCPDIIISHLDDVLHASLPGLDGNDQKKTRRALGLYSYIWGYICCYPTDDDDDGSLLSRGSFPAIEYTPYDYSLSPSFQKNLATLPSTSPLLSRPPPPPSSSSLATPIQSIAPHILHRITTLLSTLGPREKANNNHHSPTGGNNIGHYLSQIDHDNKRAFSHTLESCLSHLIHSLSPKEDGDWIRRFLEEFLTGDGGLLPHAAKDVGGLVRAIMDLDQTKGLDLLMRVWVLEKKSPKSILRYRVRVIANAIRYSGKEVLRYKKEFMNILDVSLRHEDKGVRKSGCKLLRHLLGCLVECYPLDWRVRTSKGIWGSGAEIKETTHDERLLWHSPMGEEIDYAVDLLRRYPLSMMGELTEDATMEEGGVTSSSSNSSRAIIEKWRSAVKVLHYALRGAIRIIIDEDIVVVDVKSSDTTTPLNAYMQATLDTISLSSPSSRETLHNLRSKLSSRLVQIVTLICHVESSSSSPLEVFSDAKLAKEVLSSLSLLSCLYGANPHHLDLLERTHDDRTFSARDVVLQSHYRSVRKSFDNNNNDSNIMEQGLRLLKNGEGGGKRHSWNMIMNRLWMHYERLQHQTSHEMPRRLRLLIQQDGKNDSVKVYKDMVMGVLNLCCHESIVIRGLAHSSLDTMARYHYWMIREQVPRLLSAINLDDANIMITSSEEESGFTIPSCATLAIQAAQTDRDSPSAKLLATTLRGIGNILQLKKCMKDIVGNIHHRAVFMKSMVGVQRLLEAVPEDHASMIQLVMNTLFLQFRGMWYEIEEGGEGKEGVGMDCLLYLMKNMDASGTDDDSDDDEPTTTKPIKSPALNWKYKLINLWFLMILTSQSLCHNHPTLIKRLLSICTTLIQTERGQPIQRLALGFLSRLTQFQHPPNSPFLISLRETLLTTPGFLSHLTNALTLNHRSNISHDGHKAQWSQGVEEIMRDASHNISTKTLHYPGVSRVSVRSGKMKQSHMQFVERVLRLVKGEGEEDGVVLVGKEWLVKIKELVNAPPSEDQQNEQCTAAEIFGGICRVLLSLLVWGRTGTNNDETTTTMEEGGVQPMNEKSNELSSAWDSIILPFLDDVLTNLPTDPVMYWCDALRYVFYDRQAGDCAPLLNWIITKVEESTKTMLTMGGKQQQQQQQEGMVNDVVSGNNNGTTTIDGFSSQSKWLMILSSLLIDINWSVYHDNDDDMYVQKSYTFHSDEIKGLLHVWTTIKNKLLPLLLEMLEHPYEACRNGIASCLFRICQTNRQIMHLSPSESWENEVGDARGMVVTAFQERLTVKIDDGDDEKRSRSFHHYTRITLSRFFSYCIHSGDDKRDYTDIIIPLLPLAFESLDVTQHHVVNSNNNNNDDGTTTKTSSDTNNNTIALDNDVTKSFRTILSFIATNCLITHGNHHSADISSILSILQTYSQSSFIWQIRSLTAQFLKCFQARHFFLFEEIHTSMAMDIVTNLLSDERREVSSAAMAALTGILSVTPVGEVEEKVKEVIPVANRSMKKKKKKKKAVDDATTNGSSSAATTTTTITPRERQRMKDQQTSVFFLCAAVLSRPYDTPPFVPVALEALSKHSFESRANVGVREVVKKCFSEYKRTHVDNWELHRSQFTREQLDAMADVVSTPHYYA